MLVRFNLLSIAQKFFILALLFTPIAYDLFSMRLNDFFILVSTFVLFYYKKKVSKDILLALIVIFSILTASVVAGMLVKEQVNPAGIVFYYKYALIFFVIYLCKELLPQPDFLNKVTSCYFFVFFVLCIWVYAYLILVFNGFIVGNFRPSFPLARDYTESDAHLYSSTLAIMFSAYILFIAKYLGHGLIRTFLVSVIAVVAMFLTGSRGGVLISALALLLVFFLSVLRFSITLTISRNRFVFIVMLAIIVIVCLQFFNVFATIDFSKIELLIERALNFDLKGDESSNLRLDFLKMAYADMSDSFYLFGVGPLSSAKVFFDGILSLIISHGGLSLLIFIFFLVIFLMFKFMSSGLITSVSKWKLLFLVFMYAMSNFITEYIFVTRNMLLAITGIAICFFIAQQNSQNKV